MFDHHLWPKTFANASSQLFLRMLTITFLHVSVRSLLIYSCYYFITLFLLNSLKFKSNLFFSSLRKHQTSYMTHVTCINVKLMLVSCLKATDDLRPLALFVTWKVSQRNQNYNYVCVCVCVCVCVWRGGG